MKSVYTLQPDQFQAVSLRQGSVLGAGGGAETLLTCRSCGCQWSGWKGQGAAFIAASMEQLLLSWEDVLWQACHRCLARMRTAFAVARNYTGSDPVKQRSI